MPELSPDEQGPDHLVEQAQKAVAAWQAMDLRRLKNHPTARRAVWNARRASVAALAELQRVFPFRSNPPDDPEP